MNWLGKVPPTSLAARMNPAAVPSEASVTTEEKLRCTRCNKPDSKRCVYVDRRGKRCPTGWCPEHQQVIEGRVYCARHENIISGILQGAMASAPLPDVDNRIPGLLLTIGRALDSRIMQTLRERCGSNEEVTKKAVYLAYAEGDKARVWSWRWAIEAGDILALSVRLAVREDDATRIQGLINEKEVIGVQPNWFGSALSVQEDQSARLAFNEEIFAALKKGIQNVRAGKERPSAAALFGDE